MFKFLVNAARYYVKLDAKKIDMLSLRFELRTSR